MVNGNNYRTTYQHTPAGSRRQFPVVFFGGDGSKDAPQISIPQFAQIIVLSASETHQPTIFVLSDNYRTTQ